MTKLSLDTFLLCNWVQKVVKYSVLSNGSFIPVDRVRVVSKGEDLRAPDVVAGAHLVPQEGHRALVVRVDLPPLSVKAVGRTRFALSIQHLKYSCSHQQKVVLLRSNLVEPPSL